MIKLDLVEMLPTVRKAFDNKELQMFQPDENYRGCLYSGPCAIGVCLDGDSQALLDAQQRSAIDFILLDGLVEAPESQINDLVDLQYHHDYAVGASEYKAEYIEKFEKLLNTLEKKYRPGAEL